MLIDNPEAYTDDEVEQLMAKATMLASSVISGDASRKAVSDDWMATKDRIMNNESAYVTTRIVSRTAVVPTKLGETKIGELTGKVFGGTWMKKLLTKEITYNEIEHIHHEKEKKK